jgi:23S rRNA (uracil1939-C5)-methyltransferase
MKKNDVVLGCVSDYTSEGLGVVKLDGFPVFVKDMMIGECGEIVLTLVKKNFGYGRRLSIVKESKDRVLPRCSVVKQCGGCQIMHMSKEHQAQFKQNLVVQVMKRIAKVDTEVRPILTMSDPWFYRNKVAVPVKCDNEGVKIGFYRTNSHEIIDMEECMVQSKEQNEIIAWMRTFLMSRPIPQLRHIIIRQAFKSKQVMVAFVTRYRHFDHQEKLVELLTKRFDYIKSVMVTVNNRDDNVIMGDSDAVLFGQNFIEDELMGLKFKVSLRSFFQVNPIQTEVLYHQVYMLADLKKTDVLLDLYCGVGTIGGFLARFVDEVIGVDSEKSAIDDAWANAMLNHIPNIDFWAMDAKGAKKRLADDGKKVDVIVVDPPRKGLSAEVIADILEIAPQRLIYVSCDPATLARDIALLKEQYDVKVIQPVDMFPQTVHVETVVLMTRLED